MERGGRHSARAHLTRPRRTAPGSGPTQDLPVQPWISPRQMPHLLAQSTALAQRTSAHPPREPSTMLGPGQRAAEGVTRTPARCGWGCRRSAGSRGSRPRDDHRPRERRSGLRSSGRPRSAAARRAAHPLVAGRNTQVSQPHRCLCGPRPRSAGSEAASARDPCSASSTGLGRPAPPPSPATPAG
jgi:hypothetical protein